MTPEINPIMDTADDKIGCHAVAREAIAATPVNFVSVSAAVSV